jgi:hypothetical protein
MRAVNAGSQRVKIERINAQTRPVQAVRQTFDGGQADPQSGEASGAGAYGERAYLLDLYIRDF